MADAACSAPARARQPRPPEPSGGRGEREQAAARGIMGGAAGRQLQMKEPFGPARDVTVPSASLKASRFEIGPPAVGSPPPIGGGGAAATCCPVSSGLCGAGISTTIMCTLM